MGRHAFALSALILYCANGFGFKPLYEVAAVGLLLALFSLRPEPGKPRLNSWALLFCGALLTAFPQLSQLSGILALLLFASGSSFAYGTAILFAATPGQLAFNLPCSFLHPIATAALAGVGFFISSKWPSRKIASAALATYGLLSIISVTTTPTLSVPGVHRDEWSTRVGDAIEKIVAQPLPKSGILLHESPRHAKILNSQTIIAEHETIFPKEVGIKAEGDLRQSRPWRWNQTLGSEAMRFAAANDGFLVTNLGTKLKGDFRPIASMMAAGEVQPLFITRNGRFIAADSDPFLNFLAPYQASVCDFLGKLYSRYRIFGVLSAITMIAGALWISAKDGARLVACMSVVLLIGGMIVLEYPKKGDVRRVGANSGWPHDFSGIGVVATMQKQGMNFIWGDYGCRVLVVGEGRTGRSRGEQLILLEPNSSVRLPSGRLIKCGSRPLGAVEGVVDARPLQVEGTGSAAPCCRISLEGLTIIGTGGPARQTQFSKWISQNP